MDGVSRQLWISKRGIYHAIMPQTTNERHSAKNVSAVIMTRRKRDAVHCQSDLMSLSMIQSARMIVGVRADDSIIWLMSRTHDDNLPHCRQWAHCIHSSSFILTPTGRHPATVAQQRTRVRTRICRYEVDTHLQRNQ